MNDHTSEDDPELDVDWWASRLVDREIEFADVPADLRGSVQARSAAFMVQRRTLLRSGAENVVDESVTNAAIAAALRSPTATVIPLRRRLAPILAVAAVSIGVIAIGTSILRPDDSTDETAVEFADMAANVDVVREAEIPAAVTSESVVEGAAPESDTASAMGIDDAAPTIPPADELSEMATANVSIDTVEIADENELSELFRSWIDSSPPTSTEAPSCDDDFGRPELSLTVTFAGIEARVYFSPEDGVSVRAISDCSILASIVP